MKKETLIAAAMLVFLVASVCFAEIRFMNRLGEYKTEQVYDVLTEDLDADRVKEVVVLTKDSVDVLSETGELEWSYRVDNPTAVDIEDVDGDGYGEVIVASGGKINEVERGNLYILNRKGKPLHVYDHLSGVPYPQFLYNSVKLCDLDANSYSELVGGCSNGIYVLRDTYDKVNWSFRTNDSVKKVFIDESASGVEIYAVTFHHIYLFSPAGNLLSSYESVEGIRDMYFGDVSLEDGGEIIILTGDRRIAVLNKSLSELLYFNSVGNISGVGISDLGNNDIEELVLGSAKSVYLLNNRLAVEKRYDVGEPVSWIYGYDWDEDREKEIVFAKGSELWFMNQKGLVENTMAFEKTIDIFIKDDLDSDGKADFIVYSGGILYLMESRGSVIKEEGDMNYAAARAFVEAGEYSAAASNLSRAEELYAEVGDEGGLARCAYLRSDIASRIRNMKMDEAQLQLTLAEKHFSEKDYIKAAENVKSAETIYLELNYSEGMESCTSLYARIQEETKKRAPENKGAVESLLDTSNKVKEDVAGNINATSISILVLVGLILLLFAKLALKRDNTKNEK